MDITEKTKALNFDLDTDNLKKFYPKEDYRDAYKDIKRFLCKNGFTHRQWSGYKSKEPMSEADINMVIGKLTERFSWLKECVTHFDVTVVGKQYDLLPIFENDDELILQEKSAIRKEHSAEITDNLPKNEEAQNIEKALNFDLCTENLEKYYPKGDYHNAYRDIRNFLSKNGFEHRQGSGYKSTKPLSESDVAFIIGKMAKKFPWLKKCIEHFDVTEVKEQYDLTALITGIERLPAKEKSPPQQEQKPRMTMSRNQTKAVAQKIAAKPREHKEKSKDKGMEH